MPEIIDSANGFFITGTDTGVGKTVFTAALLRFFANKGFKAAGLKPIASGFELLDGRWQNDDVRRITAAANVMLPPERVNRYAFEPAIAPHIAAAEAGVSLDLRAIDLDVQFAQTLADKIVVEGVGGWLVPLDQQYTIASLATQLRLPIILVVGMRLGCLNHALLTAQSIKLSGLPFAGWVANCVDPEFSRLAENIATLEARMPSPRLFDVPFCSSNDECIARPIRQAMQ